MAQFDYSKVKDPTFFKENVLAAHSSHIAYGNKGELFDGKSSLRASLDGIWKFSYAVNYESSVKGFEKATGCAENKRRCSKSHDSCSGK